MNLKGKIAIVTGGNSGLGFEVVKELMNKGCRVYAIGKDESKIKDAVGDLKSDLVTPVVCDIRSATEVESKLKEINDVDILVNCAGIIAYQPLEKHDVVNIKDIVETNLLGTIYVTREVLLTMKARNSGTIINVSSTSGLPTGGHAYESVYIASKYGVSGFTEALKKEIDAEKKNIRLIGFFPGGMKTQLFSKSGLSTDTSNFMDPGEIAKIISFLIEQPGTIKIDTVVVNRNKNYCEGNE